MIHGKHLKLALAAPTYLIHPNKAACARSLRRDIQGAGCAFIKVGQWVSTRQDIFPLEITQEFAALRTEVPPMSQELLSPLIPQDVFATFDVAPISSGSIAQVHRATLADEPDTPVAVKLQRPNLARDLETDVRAVKTMLWPYKLFNPKLYEDMMASVDDLVDTIRRELDFRAEAQHMERFRDVLPDVRVPRVYPRYTTDTMIVMEYLPSMPLKDPNMCSRLMHLFLHQFFEVGYVHSDLHAGNLGVDAANNLILYDFGSVQECPDSLRVCTKYLMVCYLHQDTDVMLDYLLRYDVLRTTRPLTPAQRDMLRSFLKTVLAYVENTDVHEFASTMASIAMPEDLEDVKFMPEVFMLLRTFTLLEGLCKELNPRFVIIDHVLPFATYFLTDPSMYVVKLEDDLRALAAWFGENE